jgi:hypothetical protein
LDTGNQRNLDGSQTVGAAVAVGPTLSGGPRTSPGLRDVEIRFVGPPTKCVGAAHLRRVQQPLPQQGLAGPRLMPDLGRDADWQVGRAAANIDVHVVQVHPGHTIMIAIIDGVEVQQDGLTAIWRQVELIPQPLLRIRRFLEDLLQRWMIEAFVVDEHGLPGVGWILCRRPVPEGEGRTGGIVGYVDGLAH